MNLYQEAMMFSILLVLCASLLTPEARAACDEVDYPDIDDRLTCIDALLTAVEGALHGVGAGQAALNITVGGNTSDIETAIPGVLIAEKIICQPSV